MKNVVTKIIVFSVGIGVLVGIIIALTGDATAALSVAMFTTALYITLTNVEELKKTNTDLQTQIADLKRDLEEVKGKMKE